MVACRHRVRNCKHKNIKMNMGTHTRRETGINAINAKDRVASSLIWGSQPYLSFGRGQENQCFLLSHEQKTLILAGISYVDIGIKLEEPSQYEKPC